MNYARRAKCKGAGNAFCHHTGSPERLVEMSNAFAKAMVELMKKSESNWNTETR